MLLCETSYDKPQLGDRFMPNDTKAGRVLSLNNWINWMNESRQRSSWFYSNNHIFKMQRVLMATVNHFKIMFWWKNKLCCTPISTMYFGNCDLQRIHILYQKRKQLQFTSNRNKLISGFRSLHQNSVKKLWLTFFKTECFVKKYFILEKTLKTIETFYFRCHTLSESCYSD